MSSSTHNTDASSDPVVLVTGSSTGIGAEIARRFGAAGYRVAVNSANSVDEGEKVASDIPGAIYFRADISDDTEAKDLVNRVVAEFGGLDILVNNAGGPGRSRTRTSLPRRSRCGARSSKSMCSAPGD